MPVIIRENVSKSAFTPSELLHPETGELTIEAQVHADFLAGLDLSSIATVEGINDLAVDAEIDIAESGTPTKVRVLPGEVAAAVVDEDDLAGMFTHYIREFAQAVAKAERPSPLATLESKARVQPFLALLDEDGDANAQERSGRQLAAMLRKGAVVTAVVKDAKPEAFKAPALGVKEAAAFNRSNRARLKESVKRKIKESDGFKFEASATPLFGLGLTTGSVRYEGGVREDAPTVVADRKKASKVDVTPTKTTTPVENKDGIKGATRTVAEGAKLAGQMLKPYQLNETT